MRKVINKLLVVFVIVFFITASLGDKTLSLYSASAKVESSNICATIPTVPSVDIDDLAIKIEIVNGVAVIVGVKDGVTEVIIPGSVCDKNGDEYEITKIEKPDDGKWDKITSIVFTEPSNITSIAKDSMEGLDHVKSIILPSSLVKIEESGILCLENLEWAVVPKSVLQMGKEAFKDVPSSCVFYCEANSKPNGWNSGWTNRNCKVYWGKGINWEYNSKGVPVPIT